MNSISKWFSKFAVTALIAVLSFVSVSAWADDPTGPLAVVNVVLHPGGSFQAKTSDITGSAKVGPKGEVSASNIVVKLSNLQTGIGLRDTHTKKHLDVEQFPEATLSNATGTDGKGTGTIKIRGIEKPITGTYEVKGAFLVAHFPLTLSDFKIDGIKYMGIGVDDKVTLDVTVPVAK